MIKCSIFLGKILLEIYIKKTSKFRNKSKNENEKEKYTPNFRKNNTYTEKQLEHKLIKILFIKYPQMKK